MNSASPQRGVGKVYLVGAGPGDPGLITVRGQACLTMADVVLYDALSNPELLHTAPQAECICVGKHGQTPLWTQADINQRLVELAQQGRTVVRLKGGDPAVFARTAEELQVLAAANIPFEVVPGITAALAASSYVGIPITHRQHASAVAFVTGQQQTEGDPLPLDWQALAHFPGTLVLYMGVTTVEQWTTQLIQAGKAPTTPAAIIRRCTWSDQAVARCTLSEVAGLLHAGRRVRPPVIVIVGEVAALGENFDWFTSRPLHGCGVLVTRAPEQANELVSMLRELGADVYQQPVFEVIPPVDLSSLDLAIDQLMAGQVSGITFASSNAVDGLLARCWERGADARLAAGVCLACVGPATREQLRTYGLRADVAPDVGSEFSAAGLLNHLPAALGKQNWIVTTTNRSLDTLATGLRARGAQVHEALCYQTRTIDQPCPEIIAAIEAGKIQYVTITSGYVAEAAHQMLGKYRQSLQPLSLGHNITQRLAELGWPAVAQADRHTTQALVETLVRWHQHSSSCYTGQSKLTTRITIF